MRNISELMNARGWRVGQLASATGISAQGLYKIVRGDAYPGPDNLERIARAFNITVPMLLGEARTENKIPPDILDALARCQDTEWEIIRTVLRGRGLLRDTPKSSKSG